MSKSVNLPVHMPVYTTFNYLGTVGIVTAPNKSFINWFYNNGVSLRCNKKFLGGYTSPDIVVPDINVFWIDQVEKIGYNIRFIKNDIHSVIKNMLEEGYYVYFNWFDDYYIEGKSFYKQRHMPHDGLICGYDDEDGTYKLAAYNQNLVYCTFNTPQKCFDKAMNSMIERENRYAELFALKSNDDYIELDLKCIKKKIKKYLSSNFINNPPRYEPEGEVYGIIVHDYIVMYLDRLLDDSIPYERTDKRVFRMLWEHKQCMFDRICAVENKLGLDNQLSNKYKIIRNESNAIRLMYAKYCLKQDKSLISSIRQKLIFLKNEERKVLKKFIRIL